MPLGGDIAVSGGGGGGGRASRDAVMLRLRVGVFAEGVLVLLGGAGGGWVGRTLPPRVGVPKQEKFSTPNIISTNNSPP